MHRRDFLVLLAATPTLARAAVTDNYSKLVYPGKNGRLIYVPDEKGNTIPDFSNCGYMGGGVEPPKIRVAASVKPGNNNDAVAIQSAIDTVSTLPPDKNGFRGAVLLKSGTYKIGEPIRISTSGVVLRGEDETVLIATRREQHSLIVVAGRGGGKTSGAPARILDDYVPVSAKT